MTFSKFALLTAGIVSFAASANAATLVQHLALDGNANGTVGSGGAESGTVTYVAGKFGQAAQVADNDGHITLIDDVFATFGAATDFSISLWVNADNYAGGDPAFASNKDWGSGSNVGINFAVKGNGGTEAGLDVNTYGASGPRVDLQDGDVGTLTDGEWENLILTVDRDGNTELFINGVSQGSLASSQGSFDGAYNFVLLDDGTGNYNGSGNNVNLRVDDLAIYTGVLSSGEIAALQTASANIPEPGSFALLGLGACALIRRRRA